MTDKIRIVKTLFIYILSLLAGILFLIIAIYSNNYNAPFYIETFLLTFVTGDFIVWNLVESLHIGFFEKHRSFGKAARFYFFLASIFIAGVISSVVISDYRSSVNETFVIEYLVAGACFLPFALFYFNRRYGDTSPKPTNWTKLKVKSRKWTVAFVFFIIFILAIFGFMISFLYVNGFPFLNNEKTFEESIPIYYFEKGESPSIPNVAIWVNLTTTNTVGHVFIAGQEIRVSALLYIGNTSNPMLSKNANFDLAFQDAIGSKTVIQHTSIGNFTEPVPLLIGFDSIGNSLWFAPCCYNITFPSEGSFTPIVYLYNSTGMQPIQFVENSTFIPIESPSVINTQSYNQVNEALTYALVFFGLVELLTPLIGTYHRAFSDRKEQPKKETETDHANTYLKKPELNNTEGNEQKGEKSQNGNA